MNTSMARLRSSYGRRRFSFPSARRCIVLAVLLLSVLLAYRLSTSSAPSQSRGIITRKILSQVPQGALIQDDNISRYTIPAIPASQAHLSPSQHFYYDQNFSSQAPPDLTHLKSLLACTKQPNPHTKHIRLPNPVFNVSSIPRGAEFDGVHKFNPTIIALPYWSPNHYLLVSRVVTEGLHQESLLCEANICRHPNNYTSLDDLACTASDITELGHAGGLRCVTKPVVINIPPTPAERCTGVWSAFPNIPGFHDPRIFWSGKNEPLIIVNSGSRYGCVGLWITDLRPLYKPLDDVLKGHYGSTEGPLMSYPGLTELTRNPKEDRSPVEKNWMLFFPSKQEAFVHYDMVAHGSNTRSAGKSGRAFAKLIGNGYTTPNLADPDEKSCFAQTKDSKGNRGRWHQGSNALKLILCTHGEAKAGQCGEDEEGTSVHFAVVHRKFSNAWRLPLRYERWLVVWEGRAPFRLLAKSRFPVLFKNETASGWTAEENWEGKHGIPKETVREERRWVNASSFGPNATMWLNESHSGHNNDKTTSSHSNESDKRNWAYFTYTPSIAWAWRPKSADTRKEDRDAGADNGSNLHSLNVGYLDDEVIVGIGLEDMEQAFARVQARTLLQCLEVCPGAGTKGEVS